jgi:hypothetical protein
MHLDSRRVECTDSVANRDTGMGIGSGIDQQNRDFSARFVNPINNRTFAVRLESLDPEAQFAPQPDQAMVDIAQGGPAVNFGFAGT